MLNILKDPKETKKTYRVIKTISLDIKKKEVVPKMFGQ